MPPNDSLFLFDFARTISKEMLIFPGAFNTVKGNTAVKPYMLGYYREPR